MSTTVRNESTTRLLAVGDRIAVRRHSGMRLRGTVTEIGEWHPSCAGSPMRWVSFTEDRGAPMTVADTTHRDNDITRLVPYAAGVPGEVENYR